MFLVICGYSVCMEMNPTPQPQWKPRRTPTGKKTHLGIDGSVQFACGARGRGTVYENAEVTCKTCLTAKGWLYELQKAGN